MFFVKNSQGMIVAASDFVTKLADSNNLCSLASKIEVKNNKLSFDNKNFYDFEEMKIYSIFGEFSLFFIKAEENKEQEELKEIIKEEIKSISPLNIAAKEEIKEEIKEPSIEKIVDEATLNVLNEDISKEDLLKESEEVKELEKESIEIKEAKIEEISPKEEKEELKEIEDILQKSIQEEDKTFDNILKSVLEESKDNKETIPSASLKLSQEEKDTKDTIKEALEKEEEIIAPGIKVVQKSLKIETQEENQDIIEPIQEEKEETIAPTIKIAKEEEKEEIEEELPKEKELSIPPIPPIEEEKEEKIELNIEKEPKEPSTPSLSVATLKEEKPKEETFVAEIVDNIPKFAKTLSLDTSSYKMLLKNYLDELLNYIPQLQEGSNESLNMLKDAGQLLSLNPILEELKKVEESPYTQRREILALLKINILKIKDAISGKKEEKKAPIPPKEEREEKEEIAPIIKEEKSIPTIQTTQIEEELEKKDDSLANFVESQTFQYPIRDSKTLLEDASIKYPNYDPQTAADDLKLPKELIIEFVEDFIQQSKEHLDILVNSYFKKDLKKIQGTAHMLKGAASNLRIDKIAQNLLTLQNETSFNNIAKELYTFAGLIKGLAEEIAKSKDN